MSSKSLALAKRPRPIIQCESVCQHPCSKQQSPTDKLRRQRLSQCRQRRSSKNSQQRRPQPNRFPTATIEEAAFAVDKSTGKVYAALLREGKQLNIYGENSADKLPDPLRQWVAERSAQ